MQPGRAMKARSNARRSMLILLTRVVNEVAQNSTHVVSHAIRGADPLGLHVGVYVGHVGQSSYRPGLNVCDGTSLHNRVATVRGVIRG